MPMSLEMFHELLDLHGSRLANWPTEYRQDVDRLLLASKEARDALTEVARIESSLRAAPPVFAPLGLLDRICQAVNEGGDAKSDPEPSSQPDAVSPPRSRKDELLFRGLLSRTEIASQSIGPRSPKRGHAVALRWEYGDLRTLAMWSVPVVILAEHLHRLFS